VRRMVSGGIVSSAPFPHKPAGRRHAGRRM